MIIRFKNSLILKLTLMVIKDAYFITKISHKWLHIIYWGNLNFIASFHLTNVLCCDVARFLLFYLLKNFSRSFNYRINNWFCYHFFTIFIKHGHFYITGTLYNCTFVQTIRKLIIDKDSKILRVTIYMKAKNIYLRYSPYLKNRYHHEPYAIINNWFLVGFVCYLIVFVPLFVLNLMYAWFLFCTICKYSWLISVIFSSLLSLDLCLDRIYMILLMYCSLPIQNQCKTVLSKK